MIESITLMSSHVPVLKLARHEQHRRDSHVGGECSQGSKCVALVGMSIPSAPELAVDIGAANMPHPASLLHELQYGARGC